MWLQKIFLRWISLLRNNIPKTLGGVQLWKAAKLYEGRKPFFSIKRVFSPRAPLFPKKTTKGLAALWTLAYKLLLKFCADSSVTGIDGQEWLWRAFRGYVVTERSRSNVIGIDGQEWLWRAFRVYVVTERSRSNVTGIDGQERLWRAFRGYVVTERSRSNGIGLMVRNGSSSIPCLSYVNKSS